MAFRKTFYESLEQLQRDLDEYLAFYNRERTHQGYRTQGRTPYQTLRDGLEAMPGGEVKSEAAWAKIGCHRSRPVSAHLQLNTHNALLNIEELTDHELDRIRNRYEELARQARKDLQKGLTDTGQPEVDR